MSLRFYNTLSQQVEPFAPSDGRTVRMYTCGPTVWSYAHIGNFRTFAFQDILRRWLRYRGFALDHVMNLTDVDDRIIKESVAAGKSIRDYTEVYSQAFLEDAAALRLELPEHLVKATDHIDDMVALIQQLTGNGHTYVSDGSVYFRVSTFPSYGKLSHIHFEGILDGARVDTDKYDKENARDFVLWKARKEGEHYWDTALGPGRPGWHIECSAMSMMYLGDQLDIHCGGADHVDIHHTNEIAQSEAATGRKFFNVWMHGAFLNIQGGKKMAKSEENFLTLENALVKRGIPPLAYRFASFLSHYRKPMEYSEESIQAARNGLEHLHNQVRDLASAAGDAAGGVHPDHRARFLEAINDDLNLPRAMAVVQELLKSDIPAAEKLATALDFDRVLGLDLDRVGDAEELPAEVRELVAARTRARAEKNWSESDRLRDAIQAAGYTVKDTRDGMQLIKS